MGSDFVGDLDEGGGGGAKTGGVEEEVLLVGLFKGLLPDFSPEVRKSDMYQDLDLVDGTGIPDFEFLWFFTLLLTMMMVEDEGDDGGNEGEDEGSEARSGARDVRCRGG